MERLPVGPGGKDKNPVKGLAEESLPALQGQREHVDVGFRFVNSRAHGCPEPL